MISNIKLLCVIPRQYIFKNSLTKMIDHFAAKFEIDLFSEDLNMESSNTMFKRFLESKYLTTLIDNNILLQEEGPSIDLIATNKKFSFKYNIIT